MVKIQIDHCWRSGAVAGMNHGRLEGGFAIMFYAEGIISSGDILDERIAPLLHSLFRLKAVGGYLLINRQTRQCRDHGALFRAALERFKHPLVVESFADEGLQRSAL